jgi:hypothetical protein
MGDWLKCIKIAFEHENNLKTAYQEICHLLTTNAETKVLVTYAEKEQTAKHAEDFCTIMKGETEQNILVIFGSYDNAKKVYDWTGYELTQTGPKTMP